MLEYELNMKSFCERLCKQYFYCGSFFMWLCFSWSIEIALVLPYWDLNNYQHMYVSDNNYFPCTLCWLRLQPNVAGFGPKKRLYCISNTTIILNTHEVNKLSRTMIETFSWVEFSKQTYFSCCSCLIWNAVTSDYLPVTNHYAHKEHTVVPFIISFRQILHIQTHTGTHTY